MLGGTDARQAEVCTITRTDRVSNRRTMEARLLSIERRLDTLDERFNALHRWQQGNARTIPSRRSASSEKVRAASRRLSKKDLDFQGGLLPSDEHPSAIELRLSTELSDRDFSFARFVRVPHDYYDQNLEHRRHCLGPSHPLTHHSMSDVCIFKGRSRAISYASPW